MKFGAVIVELQPNLWVGLPWTPLDSQVFPSSLLDNMRGNGDMFEVLVGATEWTRKQVNRCDGW
jgi:hypothetical protein